MSSLELKGGILELIAQIDDKETLSELKNIISEFVGNHLKDSDSWDELSEEEKSELNTAIEESKDDANQVDHSKVMEKYKKWLGK